MKLKKYLIDQKFLQDVKFTGVTSKAHKHTHVFKVNQMGDGKTRSGGHIHIIKNWKVRLEQDHIHKIDAKKAKLIAEAVLTGGYPDTGGIAGDDDYPTGNILMGRKYRKETFQGWAGPYRRSIPVDEWDWDEFESAKGMEFVRNYSETIKEDPYLEDKFGDRMFRHARKKGDQAKAMAKLDKDRKKEQRGEKLWRFIMAANRSDAFKDITSITSKLDKPDVVNKTTDLDESDVVVKISKVLEV